jgi:hypothetical protein
LDDGQSAQLKAEDLDPWDNLLNKALDRRLKATHPDSIDIAYSPEAEQVFRDYYNETVPLRNGQYAEVQGELSRAKENAIRLAIGQCVADAIEAGQEPRVLTEDHAKRGVALARFYYDQFMRLLRPAMENIRQKKCKKLVQLAIDNGGWIILRNLKNSHGFSEDEIYKMEKLFPQRFRVEKSQPSQKGGRPSEILRLLVTQVR